MRAECGMRGDNLNSIYSGAWKSSHLIVCDVMVANSNLLLPEINDSPMMADDALILCCVRVLNFEIN
jgi:hypothetical protein